MRITGRLDFDAMNTVPCPRCGERAGAHCFTPKDRRLIYSHTHVERHALLQRLFNPRLWAINSEVRKLYMQGQATLDQLRLPLDLEV